ncbi:hypothetical protein CBR_g39167 [Chara braunii]|uniref:Vesicle-fusing ATPase n=1 Tax=Chara braunii TaxID=69332 RepID=A0A388LR96_CHABU|nr:hypothetical protein CBR_g39167 [Chara braunii]|eukprot:GBG84791.1 hypothetical protein CBR_g39167 [Chara braunii]
MFGSGAGSRRPSSSSSSFLGGGRAGAAPVDLNAAAAAAGRRLGGASPSDSTMASPLRQPQAPMPAAPAGPGGARELIVKNCPSHECALTNKAYVHDVDFDLFRYLTGGSHGYVEAAVGTPEENVLMVEVHPNVERGGLGLNVQQRKNLRVSVGDTIRVRRFPQPPAKPMPAPIALMTIEVSLTKIKGQGEEVNAESLAKALTTKLEGQIFDKGQKFPFELNGPTLLLEVMSMVLEKESPGKAAAAAGAAAGAAARSSSTVMEEATRGLLTSKPPSKPSFVFETGSQSNVKIVGQRGGMHTSLFRQKEFNFQKLGIGGLDAEFHDIFRRAFASRVFPSHIISRLGIQHVKGMLLYGPPGTGKTLIARQIGKMLNGKEPKVVNGPEILNKYVGASEENIRKLFEDAEAEQKSKGDASDLHIIIFDEIDAICKSRGSTRDGTGVHDTIVNQLLTKIDGVDALNNILLIGMTNRKDLLDEALLRPGRLEVQVEIGLPDEKGRLQILHIHSGKMRENQYLDRSVDLAQLAEMTKNFSGAELEGLVKSAASFALNRQINPDDLSQPLDEENISVNMDDFRRALDEVKPAFGAAVNTLETYRLHGMLNYGGRHEHLKKTCMTLVEQVRSSSRTPLLTCLLEGPSGTGKTALAATIAIESGFPFVKIVSAENMVGYSENSKCQTIAKVFDDAYKSPLSIIVLDDIERLLEYVKEGPRFSNVILQTLLVLVKKLPPQGRKLLILGTTSLMTTMESLGVSEAFNVNVHVPPLDTDEIRKVLEELDVFENFADINAAVASMMKSEIPIKKLLMIVEMAAQAHASSSGTSMQQLSPNGGAAKEQRRRIDINQFIDYAQDLGTSL